MAPATHHDATSAHDSIPWSKPAPPDIAIEMACRSSSLSGGHEAGTLVAGAPVAGISVAGASVVGTSVGIALVIGASDGGAALVGGALVVGGVVTTGGSVGATIGAAHVVHDA